MNPGFRRSLRIAMELAASFGVLLAFDRLLLGGTAFSGIAPNPLWLPVVVMALAYGTFPALAAAGIASTLWLALGQEPGSERDYLDHLLHLSLPPLLWFMAAVAIGEVTMVRAQRLVRLERTKNIARRNVTRLTEAFHQLVHTNRALQVQVATGERSIGHVIATAARLGDADPAERRAALIALIALAAQTGDFTCYRVTGSEARAWLRGEGAQARPDTLLAPLLSLAQRRGAAIHVGRASDREALAGIGMVALPLTEGDPARLLGVLVLHDLPFAAMGAHLLAELTEICRWLGPLLVEEPRRAGPLAVQPPGMVA
ncbi:hypothetical protein [Sphingomonas sp. Leaf10]|uniref:hypothetical protein n=1 Tax=Sphingomonas sp. Leaf10 TaxID=1735676 RepID=UPI000B333DF9|nr:hypothetical protein [Sphingomonas sp. Leaf10]